MLDNFYYHWDSIIPKEYCDLILKGVDWNQKITAQVGSSLTEPGVENEKLRNTDIVWLDQLTPIGCILKSYIDAANIVCGWNYEYRGMESVQIGRYNENGHYTWHRDSANPINGFQRKLSISLLLNDPSDFDGGELEFRDVPSPKLKQGSVLVFPSFLEHKVTSVTKGVRYSAVSWVVGPTFK